MDLTGLASKRGRGKAAPSLKLQRAAEQGPLWPDVSNPAARQILEAAFDCSPLNDLERRTAMGSLVVPDWWRGQKPLSGPLETYRQMLQARLEASDLAARLASGLDMLPDISDEYPWFVRPIEAAMRPRTLKQLTWHVIQYLDWYLDPQLYSPISRTARLLASKLWNIAFLVGLVLLFTLVIHGHSPSFFWYSGFSSLIGLIQIARRYPFALIRDGKELNELKINAIEFCFYVREAYRDIMANAEGQQDAGAPSAR